MSDQPQPPEGCVYGPWWDEPTEKWRVLKTYKLPDGQPSEFMYVWSCKKQRWMSSDSDHLIAPELLRVAAERDELRAFVNRVAECGNSMEMEKLVTEAEAKKLGWGE